MLGLSIFGLFLIGTFITAAIVNSVGNNRRPVPPPEDVVYTIPETPEFQENMAAKGLKRRILGVRSPQLLYRPSTLTQTTFDTSSRADGAEIRLTNSTGSTVTIRKCQILGKIVYSHPSWIHDDLNDYGDQLRNGLKRWELSNGWMVDKDQIQKIADYWWKYFTNKKHYYTVTAPGNYAWLEPGEWYTLDVGAAGKSENINATVELISVRAAVTSRDFGRSTMVFREIEANWTITINAVTRFLASGRGFLENYQNKVVVVSADGSGNGDFYCDGTADDVELQEAIDYVNGKGGGIVEISDGTFVLAAALDLKAKVILVGQGEGSVLQPASTVSAISCQGSAGSEVVGSAIGNLAIARSTQVTADPVYDIDLDFADDFIIQGCLFDGTNAINTTNRNHILTADDCDNIRVVLNTVKDYPGSVFHITRGSGEVASNEIYRVTEATSEQTTGTVQCIVIGDTVDSQTMVNNNRIHDFLSQATNKDWHAINVGGTGVSAQVVNNRIWNASAVYSSQAGMEMFGVFVSSGATRVSILDNVIDNLMGWHAEADNHSTGIFFSGVDDNKISGNQITNCDKGIHLDSTSDRNLVSDNRIADCGQLVVYGNCENTNEPMCIDEPTQVPYTSQVTSWARSSEEANSGTYSFKLVRTGTGIKCAVYLMDNAATNDLHGFYSGVEYTFEAYAKSNTSGGVSAASEVGIAILYYDGSWTETNDTLAALDTWEKLSVTVAIPATATAIKFEFQIASAASDGEAAYYDEVRVFATKSQNAHDTCVDDDGTGNMVA